MPPIRFALWAAVSTKEQALDDKASLRIQEQECRRAATERGWVETAGPYVVRGASRTRWVSLHDAEIAIPELRAMLDAAQRRDFDVLVVKDYDRFRDILDQIFRVINDYGVQLYSLVQSIEPSDPDHFDPEANDSQELLIAFSQLRSRTEIRTTRRRYRTGMPERATRHGLPVIIPYGYRKPPGREADRRAVPEQVPDIVPHIIAIKDAFLSGQSLSQIAAALMAAQVPAPQGGDRWHVATLAAILRHPFYAGQVRWGNHKIRLDRRTGRRSREDNRDEMIISPGKHAPLWDEHTHRALLSELERRARHYSGRRTQALGGLLLCNVCGQRLWVEYRKPGRQAHDPDQIDWCCSSRLARHTRISNPAALRLVIDALKDAITNGVPESAAPADASAEIQLVELRQRLARIRDAYDGGAYDLAELQLRSAPLQKEIAKIDNGQQDARASALAALQRARILASLAGKVDQIDDVILLGDAQAVNQTLRQIIAGILVVSKKEIKVTWR